MYLPSLLKQFLSFFYRGLFTMVREANIDIPDTRGHLFLKCVEVPIKCRGVTTDGAYKTI